MKKTKCISCGNVITKSSSIDPYVCRKCEKEHGIELEEFSYLDIA